MLKAIGSVLILVALLVAARAQSSSEVPILEVYSVGAGMVSIDGKYLFLRVHVDGKVEFEEHVTDSVGRKLIKREYSLGVSGQERLEQLLADVLAESTPGEFEPDAATIDHIIQEDIRINIGSKTKSIRLVNFAPRFSKDPEKYSAKLLELECSIRAMRARRKFRMLGND